MTVLKVKEFRLRVMSSFCTESGAAPLHAEDRVVAPKGSQCTCP